MVVVGASPYLASLKVVPLQLQAVGPSAPADHFGDGVGDLLHGALHSVHCCRVKHESEATESGLLRKTLK